MPKAKNTPTYLSKLGGKVVDKLTVLGICDTEVPSVTQVQFAMSWFVFFECTGIGTPIHIGKGTFAVHVIIVPGTLVSATC